MPLQRILGHQSSTGNGGGGAVVFAEMWTKEKRRKEKARSTGLDWTGQDSTCVWQMLTVGYMDSICIAVSISPCSYFLFGSFQWAILCRSKCWKFESPIAQWTTFSCRLIPQKSKSKLSFKWASWTTSVPVLTVYSVIFLMTCKSCIIVVKFVSFQCPGLWNLEAVEVSDLVAQLPSPCSSVISTNMRY